MAYDYVIVGAGSAGCALARRLSDDPEVTVLLLEAGGADDRPEIFDPMGWPVVVGSDLDWAYTTTPQAATNGLMHAWPRGKVLGGSSAMNGMVYMRGSRADFDGWAAAGNKGWDYESVLAEYCELETFRDGDEGFHGTDGPLLITRPVRGHPICAAFIEGAVALGHRRVDDFNGAVGEGAGWHQLNIADGKRESSASAFLAPVLPRANLRITTNATARRLLINAHDRADAVEYERGGQPERADVEREVIVCAGAVDSPKLLMLSGVGPAPVLKAANIPVRVDLPGVGENLQDHVGVGLTYEARQPIPPGYNQTSEAGLFCRSSPDVPHYDLQMGSMHIAYYAPGFEVPDNSYTIMTGVLKLHSRGRITLNPNAPEGAPLIDPNYLAKSEDLELCVRAVELAREIGEHDAMSEWRLREVLPGSGHTTREQLTNYVRRAAVTWSHPAGTCKMGVETDAVVDPELRVRGLTNVRVADASVMPQVTSGNTNAPAIMIGWKAGGMLSKT